MILLEAQQFLNNLYTLVGITSIYQIFFDKCQNLIDNYWKNEKVQFLNNFFKSRENIPQNIDHFVSMFNNLIMVLHIKIKKETGQFIPISKLNFQKKINCINCNNNNFEYNENMIMCNECGLVNRNLFAPSWNDVARVYIAPIYTYNRKNQFREYILQYQGKCLNINYSILDNLLIKKTNKITKYEFLNIVRTTLKDKLKIEHVHGLYYKFYNIEIQDLSIVENNLLNNFDQFFNQLHNSMWKNEKIYEIFISNQFLLYQFLNLNNVPTTKDDVLLYDNSYNNSLIYAEPIFNHFNWKIF